MEFPLELAEKIVNILHEVTGNNVNFMGEGGIIQASIQIDRVGTVHEGAKKIMAGEIDELAITLEDAEKLTGVKPGYNGVVMYQNSRIGCIGLSGDPDKMRQLQQLASIVVKEEYEKYLFNQNKRDVTEKVTGEIESVSAAIEEITAGSIESLNYIQKVEETANDAEKSLSQINDVLKILNGINKQIELLGFNAVIEAARVGDAGRGFNVVAQEIKKLSLNSKKSVSEIDKFLLKIQASISDIAKGVRNSSKISQEQSLALQNISESTMEIQAHTENLSETLA